MEARRFLLVLIDLLLTPPRVTKEKVKRARRAKQRAKEGTLFLPDLKAVTERLRPDNRYASTTTLQGVLDLHQAANVLEELLSALNAKQATTRFRRAQGNDYQ